MTSTLNGFLPALEKAGIPQPQVDEIGRVLDLLRGEGWSGYIPADEALRAIINDEREEDDDG